MGQDSKKSDAGNTDPSPDNSYQARQEARRQLYAERAEAAEGRAAAHRNAGDRIASVIPMGQPILVGHHSERRHRRDIERIQNSTRKTIEEMRKAEHFRRKAADVGEGGISSDDPDARKELQAKLDGLEKRRTALKEQNRKARKEDLDTLPSYVLSNLGANIRSVRKRIEALEQAEAEPERGAVHGNGYRVEEDKADNRILLFFDAKPAAEVRQLLRSNGWRWSRNRGAWCRMLNNAGRYSAQLVATKIDALVSEGRGA